MSQDTTYVQNGPADETLTRLAPCGLVCTRLRGGRNTWEGYVLSQEGPRQCCQEEGFFPGSQRLSATVLQLLVWTQSTFRDWKPWPQADVQGLQGPVHQHASQAPDEQFLQKETHLHCSWLTKQSGGGITTSIEASKPRVSMSLWHHIKARTSKDTLSWWAGADRFRQGREEWHICWQTVSSVYISTWNIFCYEYEFVCEQSSPLWGVL